MFKLYKLRFSNIWVLHGQLYYILNFLLCNLDLFLMRHFSWLAGYIRLRFFDFLAQQCVYLAQQCVYLVQLCVSCTTVVYHAQQCVYLAQQCVYLVQLCVSCTTVCISCTTVCVSCSTVCILHISGISCTTVYISCSTVWSCCNMMFWSSIKLMISSLFG